MATWTTIGDTFLEPGKPVRSVDGLALRDNPIAIAEGAAGAPRIDPIAAMEHQGAAGAVGTYSMLVVSSSGATMNTGDTQAGSFLRYSDSGDNESGTPDGTWRNMSGTVNAVGRATVMLRIS